MKLSRRTNAIILWIISAALLVGMVIMFTPSLGNIGQLGNDNSGPTALTVNDQPISELEVVRAQQSPLYQSVREGEVGDDLELLLIDNLIDQEVLRQAAARVNVSGGDVREAVREFRRANNVEGSGNDNRYLALIGNAGYTDQTFRAALREQIRVDRFREQLTEDVTVSDGEVEAYYEVNQDAYRSDARIEARMITVDDQELAARLAGDLEAGADFAELASEFSVERAERGGALGAAPGESDPRPVGRAALPTAVANAAFGLEGAGTTGVVEAAGRYYIVQVENYLSAAAQPLDEVRDTVEADALEAKRQAALQREIERLREEASVTIPEESNFSFDDRVVARVGDAEILRSDLVRATYSNPQIQQALSPQTADLIAGFFKPSTLAQLIDVELAAQGAERLDAEFLGTPQMVAQQAFDVVTRDAEATDEEIVAYYENNQQRYTVPASAEGTRYDFPTDEAAAGFRAAVLEGEAPSDAAEAFGGSVDAFGTVSPGDLASELDTALFGTDAFTDLPDSENAVSDVLVLERPVEPQTEDGEADTTDTATEDATEDATGEATDETGDEAGATGEAELGDPDIDQPEPGSAEAAPTEELFVVLIADRTPATVRPLDEVRDQVEQAVLSQERAELREAWLSELQEEIEVVDLLSQADPELDPAPGEDDAGEGTGDAGGADATTAEGADTESAEGAEPAAEEGNTAD